VKPVAAYAAAQTGRHALKPWNGPSGVVHQLYPMLFRDLTMRTRIGTRTGPRRPEELEGTMRLKIAAAAVTLALCVPVQAFAQDAAKGEVTFKKCQICHEVGPAAKVKVGPILNDVIGRKAGTLPGFAYSPAMKEAGEKDLTWSDENIGKYLENPREFVPKNKMAFVGLKKEDERADVLAYLKKFSAPK
jgi:cytochrome c